MCFAAFSHDTPFSSTFCQEFHQCWTLVPAYISSFLRPTYSPLRLQVLQEETLMSLFFVYCHRCKELFEIAPYFLGLSYLKKTEYLLFKISLKFYHYYCANFAVGVKLHILCLLHEYIYNDFEYHRSGNFGNLLFYLLFNFFFFFLDEKYFRLLKVTFKTLLFTFLAYENKNSFLFSWVTAYINIRKEWGSQIES